LHHGNEQQIQSTTPSVDITSPFTPVQIQTEQQSILSVSDTMSNDKSNLNDAHIQSHIPSPSNSNQLDLKPDQYSQIPLKQTQTTTSEPSIVQNESHPPRTVRSSTSRHHQQVHIHPRHVQTEDISLLDVNQSENVTVETAQQSVIIENKTQMNDQPINNTDIPNSKPNVSSTKDDSNKSQIENATTVLSVSIHDTNAHLPFIFGNETNDNNTNETNQYFTPIESKVSVIFSKLNYFYIIF